MAGYGNPQEVVGRPLDVIVPPEEWERVKARLKNLQEVGDSNPPVERLILRKDGSRMTIEAVSFTTLFEGKKAVVVVMRDLAEKKAAEEKIRKVEERFQRVYENSPIGIALIDLDAKILSANLKFCSILGYPSGGLDGKSIVEITHPDDLGNDLEQTKRIFAGEIDSYQIRKRYFHKDGRVIWGHLTATVVRDPSGRILYGLGMVEDITEAQKTQELLMKFERLSTIGEMAAGIAHEIRNPLATISAAAQLMKRREKGDGKNMEFLDAILEQTKRLDQLILDTLSFARAEKQVDKEPISLKGALEGALRLCQVQFGPTHSKVQVAWDNPAEDKRVLVNFQRVQQILINLILNAYQVMPEGGTLGLSLREKDGWALVRVSDTGPGVKPEDRGRIFEPFFTTKSTGSGLGLAISQRVAEQHGGKIELEFLEPRGTAFTLRLPLDPKGKS
jgi:PAS domain S-box-containing protein